MVDPKRRRQGSLNDAMRDAFGIFDPMLVWELYNRVEYSPPPRRSSVVSSDDDGVESDHTPLVNGSATHDIPR